MFKVTKVVRIQKKEGFISISSLYIFCFRKCIKSDKSTFLYAVFIISGLFMPLVLVTTKILRRQLKQFIFYSSLNRYQKGEELKGYALHRR